MFHEEVNIAIIKANWHSELTNKLKEDCIEELNKYYLNNNIKLNIYNYSVPGAVELNVVAKNIIEHKKIDAVICIGVVIKGESDHYIHVANQASYGCQKVSLDTSIPVIFGVLICENLGIARARVNGEHSKSGKEWAFAAIDTIKVINSIKMHDKS